MRTPDRIIKPQEITQEKGGGLTPEYTANLLFWSFKLSQGNPELQKVIFEYLHCVHPEWQIVSEMRESFLKESVDVISKYLNNSSNSGHYLEQKQIKEEVRGQLQILSDALNKDPKMTQPKEHVLKVLVERFIGRDFTYTIKERKSGPNTYYSYICDYIIGGKSTSIKEYDQMLAELKPMMNDILAEDEYTSEISSRLKNIIEKHGTSYETN